MLINNFSKNIWAILFFCLIYSGHLAAKEPPCDASKQHPCLVQDSKNKFQSIGVLRDILMIKEAYNGNKLGLDELWVSASAMPTAKGLQQVIAYIRAKTKNQVKKIIVVDLRQEHHGYLNGNTMTLAEQHNWINLGKTKRKISIEERKWFAALSSADKIENVLTAEQFDQNDYTRGKTVKPMAVQSEKELVTSFGLGYRRIYVADHQAPTDQEVDTFLSFIDKLPAKSWLHFHCRGGKGRSTTFLAMVDMLKNADKVEFNEIIKRHASIMPFYDLFDLTRSNPAMGPFYEQRLRFLNAFYLFAQEKIMGYPDNWSAWKQAHPFS